MKEYSHASPLILEPLEKVSQWLVPMRALGSHSHLATPVRSERGTDFMMECTFSGASS